MTGVEPARRLTQEPNGYIAHVKELYFFCIRCVYLVNMHKK